MEGVLTPLRAYLLPYVRTYEWPTVAANRRGSGEGSPPSRRITGATTYSLREARATVALGRGRG